jgi:hypothetical protein
MVFINSGGAAGSAPDIWECDSASGAATQVEQSNGLARIATPEDLRKHKWWKCDSTIVVFEPPHVACRFRAYNSLAEGARRWVATVNSAGATATAVWDADGAASAPVCRRVRNTRAGRRQKQSKQGERQSAFFHRSPNALAICLLSLVIPAA